MELGDKIGTIRLEQRSSPLSRGALGERLVLVVYQCLSFSAVDALLHQAFSITQLRNVTCVSFEIPIHSCSVFWKQ